MGRLSEYDDIELRAMGLGSGWVEPLEDPRNAEIEHDYDIHHDPGDENDVIDSAFPPCAICGAIYEAHEEVDILGIRGHRINAPTRPQHGVYHYFTPLPPNEETRKRGQHVQDTKTGHLARTKLKLIRNAARCRKCGDIVESRHRHDWRSCSCGAMFVDGGLEYQRRGGDLENIEEMSEFQEV